MLVSCFKWVWSGMPRYAQSNNEGKESIKVAIFSIISCGYGQTCPNEHSCEVD